MRPAALQVDGDVVRLSGDLTFATVSGLYTRMEVLARSEGMPRSIDLAGIRQIDSAGLALLLEWQAAYRKHQRDQDDPDALMRIDNPPGALLKIARLCDAEDYLSNGAAGRTAGEEEA